MDLLRRGFLKTSAGAAGQIRCCEASQMVRLT
jgi:hypothetical protein